MQLQVPVQVDMSDQIPLDLRCHRAVGTVIVPRCLLSQWKHREPGSSINTQASASTNPDTPGTRQVNRYQGAGERSYPCMDRGGSGNQCCNPGLGSGLLGLSISVLGSRPPLGDEMTMSQNSLSLSSSPLHALFVAIHVYSPVRWSRPEPRRSLYWRQEAQIRQAAQNLRSYGWQSWFAPLPGPWHLLILPPPDSARQPCTLMHSGGNIHFQLCRV